MAASTGGITLENFRLAFDPLYRRSSSIGAGIAGRGDADRAHDRLSRGLCDPLQPPRRQTALLFLAVLPFWTNYLIRTYAWIVLLNREGLINQLLRWIGLTAEPLPILYTEFAVILGLVYNYVPFVILGGLFGAVAPRSGACRGLARSRRRGVRRHSAGSSCR